MRGFIVGVVLIVSLTAGNVLVESEAEESVMTQPIDSQLFEASGDSVRSFAKEVVIEAAAGEVYDTWTTPTGWSRIYGPPSASRIDLAIGGRYEWLFDGKIGSNGCQVLSYIPGRMISFSWNAPPAQAESRARRTWVVVELEPLSDDRTSLRLTHLGFGEGPKWDETYTYFDRAWDRVLERMRNALAR